MRYLLLCVVLLSGCASSGMNSFCGHINGQELTVPYVGGKTNADAYVCHVGCVGAGCPKPEYSTIQAITETYLKAVQVDGKLTTTGPGTITFTPTKA